MGGRTGKVLGMAACMPPTAVMGSAGALPSSSRRRHPTKTMFANAIWGLHIELATGDRLPSEAKRRNGGGTVSLHR